MNKGSRRLSQGSNLVSSYIRDLVSKDIRQDQVRGLPYLESLSEHSLCLPLGLEIGGGGENLEDDPFMTDKRMRAALEEARLINWCPGIKKQVPLAVSNDGNTLCHSASMALWGIHDRNLDLRQLIAKALHSEAGQDFHKRWQKEVIASRQKMEGLNYQHDMDAEWQVLIEMTSKTNKSLRSNSPIYEALEEFHIFVLANVLRRPILVYADRPIKSVEQEEITHSFSAIYLPLLWPSEQCCRSPLVLGYFENYFAPLITFGSVLEDATTNEPCPKVVPLIGVDLIPIENRYFLPEEKQNKERLLKEYLLVAEIESSKTGKVTEILTVAKLMLNQLAESQQLISEFLRSRESKDPKQQEVKVVPPIARRPSQFRCGNKACTKFIDKDHLFPYCSECSPKFTSSLPKSSNPTRRKMNSAHTVVAPTTLEVECATIECPYYAAVNCFPYCQRCHSKQNLKEEITPKENPDLILENRWQKLAMGIVDQEVVTGVTRMNMSSQDQFPRAAPDDEIIFANLHRHMPLEDGEKCAMEGGVTSTRSHLTDQIRPQSKVAVTGARSGPQRKISREELELATNTVNLDDWKRKISWINEPCTRTGCSYFASARTYPYCNQCAQDMQTAHPAQRNRKVSATSKLSTLVQED